MNILENRVDKYSVAVVIPMVHEIKTLKLRSESGRRDEIGMERGNKGENREDL